MIDFTKHSFQEIAQYFSKYHNQFVLLDKEIYQFVGFGEDKYDYYYIGAPATSCERSKDGLFRISAVCWFEPIKGKVSNRYYDMLKYTWSINNGPRCNRFIIEPVVQW